MADKARPHCLTSEPEAKVRPYHPSSSTCSVPADRAKIMMVRPCISCRGDWVFSHRWRGTRSTGRRGSEQYERWNNFKESNTHTLAGHHETYTDGLRISWNNRLKELHHWLMPYNPKTIKKNLTFKREKRKKQYLKEQKSKIGGKLTNCDVSIIFI